MKKFMMLVLAAALVLPMVGCKEKSAIDKAKEAAQEAGEKAGEAANEAAKAAAEVAK